jgi:hypothetical protein
MSRFLSLFFALFLCLFPACSQMSSSGGVGGSLIGGRAASPTSSGDAGSSDAPDAGSNPSGSSASGIIPADGVLGPSGTVSVIDTGADSGMKQKSDGHEIHHNQYLFRARYDSKPDVPAVIFTSLDETVTLKLAIEDMEVGSALGWQPISSNESSLDTNVGVRVVFTPKENLQTHQQCIVVVDADPSVNNVSVTAGQGQMEFYLTFGFDPNLSCSHDLVPMSAADYNLLVAVPKKFWGSAKIQVPVPLQGPPSGGQPPAGSPPAPHFE